MGVIGAVVYFFPSEAFGAHGSGGLQPHVAARQMNWTRVMRTRRGSAFKFLGGKCIGKRVGYADDPYDRLVPVHTCLYVRACRLVTGTSS